MLPQKTSSALLSVISLTSLPHQMKTWTISRGLRKRMKRWVEGTVVIAWRWWWLSISHFDNKDDPKTFSPKSDEAPRNSSFYVRLCRRHGAHPQTYGRETNMYMELQKGKKEEEKKNWAGIYRLLDAKKKDTTQKNTNIIEQQYTETVLQYLCSCYCGRTSGCLFLCRIIT